MSKRVVVIGAGIGGLTSAAVLARAGLDVTVLEAHIDPGGCAATYDHRGYRFDAGATLAGGFYPGGPMERAGQAAGVDAWPAQPAPIAMCVHLPGGQQVMRHAENSRWEEYAAVFGSEGVRFFRWQERTAEVMWNLALRLPPWPPQSLGDLASAVAMSVPGLARREAVALLPGLALDAARPVAAHFGASPESLRLFIDGQLLISAQATGERANALYGAAALDLPRRGVVHLTGGMGAIAETLAEAVRRHGGRVLYRQEAKRIRLKGSQPLAVETKRGETFPADLIIANLTPWNVADLFGDDRPPSLRRLGALPEDGWGAFIVYVGLDGAALPADLPLHHQVLVGRPLGEGNSIFASLSPAWDAGRAPPGHRALTLSTHTSLAHWQHLAEHDRPAYEAQKTAMTERLLETAEAAIPGLRGAARLILPGTPLTFQRFTRRKLGWVGGFPQTSLLRTFGPRLGPNLWLVGDSIFPGQSTAAVALGGLRVARLALQELGASGNPG